MSDNIEITTIPLTIGRFVREVEAFLNNNGLRLDTLDLCLVARHPENDHIIACGGLSGDTIKCLAVDATLRGTGMMQRLISALISHANNLGRQQLKVFTKPENADIFTSLGFRMLAAAPKAIFMENGIDGIQRYKRHLNQLRREGRNGLIVMNANPFTIGHQTLVRFAAQQVDTLYVIAVAEDASDFSADERLRMIQDGCAEIGNAVVVEGSEYAISAHTFPTYFLKQLSDATDTQIALDLDLCARHIMPALNASVRFVGSEPADPVTARYVELMNIILPQNGFKVSVMPRVADFDGNTISATRVRKALTDGRLIPALSLTPKTTWPSLLGQLAANALLNELDTTPKPGLVDQADCGAHSDMDLPLMYLSIKTLRPHFTDMARLGFVSTLPASDDVIKTGIRAEHDMMQATGGVNTHRGAIFSLGLTTIAAAHLLHTQEQICPDKLQMTIAALAEHIHPATDSHGQRAVKATGVDGALATAQKGYPMLFTQWLPTYQSLAGDNYRCHRTLLSIMSSLDDTNIIHRAGPDAARQVKRQAKQLLDGFSLNALRELNREYIAQNISPGGAADMLAMIIYVNSLIN